MLNKNIINRTVNGKIIEQIKIERGNDYELTKKKIDRIIGSVKYFNDFSICSIIRLKINAIIK